MVATGRPPAFVACGSPQQLPDDGFVDVPGGRIAFRVMGEGDGAPVLIIHGRISWLPELDLPTLFLVGEYDEARPETMLEFQALVPGSVVKVIPNAAHLVNVDQPEAFSDAVAEFLASVERR